MANLLLQYQASPNIQTITGWTPLMHATRKDQLNMVQLLLDYGADPTIKNKKNKTALDYAREKPCKLIISILEQAIRNCKKHKLLYQSFIALPVELQAYILSQVNTPVELAELLQNVRKVNIYFKNLVEKDAGFIFKLFADNHHKNKMWIISQIPSKNLSVATKKKIQEWQQKGRPVLDFIKNLKKDDDPEVAKSHILMFLQNGADINYQNEYGRTALMIASNNGHPKIAQSLLDNGAKVNLQSKSGWTALMSAASNGHLEIVRSLLEHQSEINLQEKDGGTALIFAVKTGHLEIVNTLLAHDPKINLHNKYAVTALISAANNGYLGTVKSLLVHGAKVNWQSMSGWTALIWAVNSDHLEIVQSLLDHGADPTIKDKENKTALDYAKEKGFTKIVSILEPATKNWKKRKKATEFYQSLAGNWLTL